MTEEKNFSGKLPDVADLDYTVMVYKHYQESFKTGKAVRFELTSAFRIGCLQLLWQSLEKNNGEYRQTHSVKLWLKGDEFIAMCELLKHKRVAPVLEKAVSPRGQEIKTYYISDFMGSPAKGGKPAESRGFKVTDALSDKYVYALVGKRCEGVSTSYGTIVPKKGAKVTQSAISLSKADFWQMAEAAKRHWYAYTSAQWQRSVIREELQKAISDYDKFVMNRNLAIQNVAEAPEEPDADVAGEAAVEPVVEAPVQQQVEDVPEDFQDDVFDYDDLPY